MTVHRLRRLRPIPERVIPIPRKIAGAEPNGEALRNCCAVHAADVGVPPRVSIGAWLTDLLGHESPIVDGAVALLGEKARRVAGEGSAEPRPAKV